VERPSGRAPYRCILSQLCPNVATGLPNLLAVSRIVLCLTDPERPCETSEELLQRMFGLTPGEARLTRSLAAGRSLQEAAYRSGIQLSTARSRLKDVFRKTDTNSQAKLAHTVLTSSLWHARIAGG
jgi:DNA-binding CsgD family transcriptional regulator